MGAVTPESPVKGRQKFFGRTKIVFVKGIFLSTCANSYILTASYPKDCTLNLIKMEHFIPSKKAAIPFIVLLVLLSIQKCTSAQSYPTFTCPSKAGDALPSMPKAFSCDIRLNFPTQLRTEEIRYFKDEVNKKEAIELITPDRHVKYIHHDQKLLLITYSDDRKYCTTKTSSTFQLEDVDAGPNKILQKIYDALKKKNQFILTEPFLENGVFMKKWEACFPEVNVSLGFTDKEWAHPMTSPEAKNQQYVVLGQAQIKDDYVIAVFDNFNPIMPNDVDFQPPEDVYCPDYREDQKPPAIPDYFSYDSELILYLSTEGKQSIVAHRSVYYDYPSRISRVDFYDAVSEGQDDSSKLRASMLTIIHDFNANIQYNFDLPSGKCEVSEFKVTSDVAEEKETEGSPMPNGKNFFALDVKRMSYNGQFKTRGYDADVYTSLVPHLDGSDGKSIYSWYFSTINTKIVENDKVDEKVLLRMVVQPENTTGLIGRVDINFYNFQRAQPNGLMFDISTCYEESYSKTFVITFPANKALRGSEKFLRIPAHLALKEITGLSKQRIVVTEVNFNKLYMFVEFKLLDEPSVLKANTTKKEISLTDAVSKIKKAISDNTFKLAVSTDDGLLYLSPEPNGFNEFSGDHRVSDGSNYKEGSVIALTIGMLLLGFLLGAITINLVISRKFGVALFQKSNSGMNQFDNPLNESSM